MNSTRSDKSEIDAALIREELERVQSSDEFRNASRQCELLIYIVESSLAGRHNDLIGKNIAENVFSIDPTSTRDMSTVRVEIGRLRRRLQRYYLEQGISNPLQIDIPVGGYSPTFSKSPNENATDRSDDRKTRFGLLIAVPIVAVVCLGGLYWKFAGQSESEVQGRVFTGNTEAIRMFHDARRVANPPVVETRVRSAIALAKEIQRVDPGFGGGFAAEALQLWNLVLFNHSNEPETDIVRAVELAKQAIMLDPEFSWSHHAMGEALHLDHDLAGAILSLRRAIDLDSRQPDHHGYLGLLLALSGEGREALGHIDQAIALSESVQTPYRNFRGIAQFHSQEFDKAAESITDNRDNGGPTGTHMYLFLAAAHAHAGNDGRASAMAQMIKSDASGFVPIQFINVFYGDSTKKDLLIEGLLIAGLTIEDLNH